MKALALLASLLLLDSVVYGKYAWETSRIDIEEREADLAFRKAKTEKTSIIVYDKHRMSEEEVAAEIDRIVSKCEELECPCEVRKLCKIGVLEVIWSCDPHPAVDDLELDGTKETGAEDQLVHAYTNSPPPTDPRFSEQWALQDLSNNADINIAEGWAEYLSDEQGGSATGPSVVVAVIDTGIDYTHPDLKGVMWTNPDEIAGDGIDNDGNGIVDDVYGADFTRGSPSGDPIDRHSHGTHCAGIIAAEPNNEEGIAGVASYHQGKVKLMAVKGLSDSGIGTVSGLLACLNYAIDKGAKISSNSWGGGTVDRIEDVWDAVLRNNLDHLFVAAAGNRDTEINDCYKSMTCGLNEPNLLCVASSTINDERSSFSNYGTDYVHVFAPGSDILSSVPNGGYSSYSGTSMACPQVSGLAALIMTMRDNMSAHEVRQLIEANVRVKSHYESFVSSSGLIDVGATIKALKGGTGNDTKNFCPSGYNAIPENLAFQGEEWHPAETTETIFDACTAHCNERQGCTSFEYGPVLETWGQYNAGDYACATFTDGDGNKANDDGRLNFKSKWRSCMKSSKEKFCPSGYDAIPDDLRFEGEKWYPAETYETILDACTAHCNDRQGCTSFEYGPVPIPWGQYKEGDYACATFTDGDGNKYNDDCRLSFSSRWRSCMKASIDCSDSTPCTVAGETCVSGACKCGTASSCKDLSAGPYCDAPNNVCACSATAPFCSGATNTCVDGICKCGSSEACSGTSDTCDRGICKCGSSSWASACSVTGDTCDSGTCKCGSSAACYGTTDTCDSGICKCGSNAECSGTTPICSSGNCVAPITKTIKIRTEARGNENSYYIGSCGSTQQYANHQSYEEDCSLAPGLYYLVCKCSYGDGWHGGYVEIDGVRYCEHFWSKKTYPVTWT